MNAMPPIPIARPWMGEAEAEAARRVLASGWTTQGPEVAAFEEEFAAFTGAPYACAVSSCTAALHLALLGVGVRAGDEVVTVSHSFIATANAIRYCGATPVFVDIDPATCNIDASLVEAAIGRKTRAILAVHQLGLPCDLAALSAIAARHALPLVEDAACAAGSEIEWRGSWQRIGRPHGVVACFSFHPRKLLSTGDGGMLTTADGGLDRQFRRLRQHGMSASDLARHRSTTVLVESYTALGFNYRLTDIQAAIGREQLKRLPEAVARRRALARTYAALLAEVPGLVLPDEPPGTKSNFQSYRVRLPEGCGQRAVMQRMLDAGVSTKTGVMCAHREPVYAGERWACAPDRNACGCGAGGCRRLARSEAAQDGCLLLPLFHEMTEDDQQRVTDALRAACALEAAPA
ncbi:MAG: DegT/DnrJ/EryC1/StrS family aminotransferase [Acidobacteria bacterium]|nr:DegT/DnrJ/EryC1/StrS family aminotransferase [Acidobacteriota bacterium]